MVAVVAVLLYVVVLEEPHRSLRDVEARVIERFPQALSGEGSTALGGEWTLGLDHVRSNHKETRREDHRTLRGAKTERRVHRARSPRVRRCDSRRRCARAWRNGGLASLDAK